VTERYDVAILGGGPAGAAAALSLRRLRPALRVALVEASRYNAWRVGETLSPGCRELLAGLGCWERFLKQRFLESFGTRAAWGGDEPYDHEFLFSAQGSGWHVDRARFDAMLCAAAREAGAEILAETRFSGAERSEDRWSLTLRRGRAGERIEASWVIDATGRSAAFAVRQGARRLAADRLVGVAVRFRAPECDPSTLVEAQPDGWWYSAATPESGLVVVWMSDADLVSRQGLSAGPRWFEQLARSRHTAARVAGTENSVAEAGPFVRAACSQRLSDFGGDGWVAAGDAACTFDPLSSQGILKALRTGKIASFAALDGLEGPDVRAASSLARYRQLLGAEYSQYLEARTWFYGEERRWPESPFWARRHPGAGVPQGMRQVSPPAAGR
jgi:flavin-dependent dehydrogenase